jgi:hypothetical protein
VTNSNKISALILGLAIFCGLAALGFLVGDAALKVKSMERSVRVKGLCEREYPADIAIWPIQFTVADNDLQRIYETIEKNSVEIIDFLNKQHIKTADITRNPPAITDKSARSYGDSNRIQFRYTATQTISVYSKDIDTVRKAMRTLADLGRKGIVFNSENYDAKTEYIFTRLNQVKPEMIEEATRKARDVAMKFAKDSNSRLGKIKRASQGQFSISARDKSTPEIKRIRVVSTIEYYLAD